ncbi:MAG: SGNH/GDSL hydrolase family protein [Candidatus Polarisedimenticolia bacterium]
MRPDTLPATPGAATRRWRGVAVNLALLLGSLAIACLGLEGTVRLFDLELASFHPIGAFCEYDEVLGWRLVPGRRGVFSKGGFSADVAISSQGLRDREYPLEKAAGRKRILVLGDSVVWCWGVDMSDCFTELVEERLPDTDVVALGVPGYGTAQELLAYERLGARFSPDLVILVFVSNDPAENLDGSVRPRFDLEDGGLVLRNVPVRRRKSRLKEWLSGHSRVYVQVNHALQVGRQILKSARRKVAPQAERPYMPLPPEQEVAAFDLTAALLRRLRDEVSSDGACLLVVLDSLGRSDRQRLGSFCAEEDVPCLDLHPRLEQAAAAGRRLTLAGDPHFSPQGHRVVADAIIEHLRGAPALCPAPGASVPRAR